MRPRRKLTSYFAHPSNKFTDLFIRIINEHCSVTTMKYKHAASRKDGVRSFIVHFLTRKMGSGLSLCIS